MPLIVENCSGGEMYGRRVDPQTLECLVCRVYLRAPSPLGHFVPPHTRLRHGDGPEATEAEIEATLDQFVRVGAPEATAMIDTIFTEPMPPTVSRFPPAPPLAWQYDADRYCDPCTQARFGPVAPGDTMPEDREGNPISPLFATTWSSGEVYHEYLECASCQRVLDERINAEWCSCEDGCYAGECNSCHVYADPDDDDGDDGSCQCDHCLEAESPPYAPEDTQGAYMAWAASL